MRPVYLLSALLEPLRPGFTQPTFDNFCLLVYGWLLARRHTLCGCLLAVGPRATKSFGTYHRTLSTARWVADEVGLALAALILRIGPQPVCAAAVDDTTTSHPGRRVWGTGYHRDAVRSKPGRNAWCRGHCWVVLCLLITVPHCRRKFALPVLCRLYLNAATAAQLKVEHRTKPELALAMVQALAARFPHQRFHLYGDANYGGESLLAHLPPTFDLTSRLMPQTALHRPLNQLRRGRGRPRKRGPRLPGLAHWATHRARRRRAVLYGQAVWVAPVAFRACLHRVPERVIQGVVPKPRNPADKPQYFYTTALGLKPEQVLEGVADRWPIETCFQECKQHLGLEQPQCRSRRAVERTTPLAFWCYSLTVLWFAASGHRQWSLQPPPWYPQKAHASFADMLALARRQCRLEFLTPCLPPGETQNPEPNRWPALPWAA